MELRWNDWDAFHQRLTAALTDLLVSAAPPRDLLDYDHQYMGDRYHLPGASEPLSVFEGEGAALYLLAAYLRPQVIAEFYTGTGYSACCLAAGAPAAQVFTIDNYLEGEVGDRGLMAARVLQVSLGLTNLHLMRGDRDVLMQYLDAHSLGVGLVFLDGPGKATIDIPVAPGCVTVTHDDPLSQGPARVQLLHGSHWTAFFRAVEPAQDFAAGLAERFPLQLGDLQLSPPLAL